MGRKRKIYTVSFIVLFFLSNVLLVSKTCESAINVDVDNLFDTAEKASYEAYKTILEAENSGADTSALIIELDQAVGSIDEIKSRSNSLPEEQLIAEINSNLKRIYEIAQEGSILKNSALNNQYVTLRTRILFSLIGVVLFLSLMLKLWTYVEAMYYKGALGMEFEVGKNDQH